MVSFDKVAPAGGAGGFISTKQLRQYAAVVIDYSAIMTGRTNNFGQKVNEVRGSFVCFNNNGDVVHEVGPDAMWEASVSEKSGRSITDSLPDAPAQVLVKFFQREGTGKYVGKSFNEMENIDESDPVFPLVVATLAKKPPMPSVTPGPVFDDGPPPF